MIQSTPAFFRRLLLIAGLVPALTAFAQESEVTKLTPYVVSPTRTAEDPNKVPGAVTVLQPADLALAQVVSLSRALARVPGLSVAHTGGVGGPTSVFMRGGNSEHTLFFVDGVRMNTGDAGYTNFLGGADLAGLDQIEVLRGPQSTLYGSSALGGVIVMNTASGHTPLVEKATVAGGSFNTYGGILTGQGQRGNLGVSVSLSEFSTDNDREFNRYDSLSYSTRVETRVNPSLVLGFTLRGQNSSSEAPGSVGSTFVGTVDNLTHLSTVYGEWQASAHLRSRLTYGWFQQEYTYTPEPPPRGNMYDSEFYSRDTRNIVDWQTNWDPADNFSLVGGLNVETETVTSVSLGTADRFDNDSRAGYLLATCRPAPHTSLLAGVRYDHFDRVGDAATWKLGISHLIPASGTKLRANYGTGFAAPRPVYVVGGPFYNANPTLQPEKSKGWDVGVDQSLWTNRANVGVTYFNNRFRNLFIYDFLIPGIVNTGKASASGLEFAFDVTPVKGVRFDLSYTYLDAQNDTNNRPLIRRPRHLFDTQATWQATPAWLIGAGVRFASGRFDDSTTAPVRVEDYTTVRLFAQYQLPQNLVLKLRVENLLDEKYAEVRGYPSLPLGVFGSIDWRF